MDLRLFDGGGVPVAHGADVEVLFAFQVSLTKELVHYSIGPTPIQVQRLRRVTQVRTVHQTLQHLQTAFHQHDRPREQCFLTCWWLVRDEYKVLRLARPTRLRSFRRRVKNPLFLHL